LRARLQFLPATVAFSVPSEPEILDLSPCMLSPVEQGQQQGCRKQKGTGFIALTLGR